MNTTNIKQQASNSERSEHNKQPTLNTQHPSPITEQTWPEGTLPIVAVSTLTYNHVDYIRNCIEGFLMQKTTFPVRMVIFDDFSTDGTREIVQEYEEKYPHLFVGIYPPQNTWKKPERVAAIIPREKAQNEAKYIAICEGDDYWTDPLKLQKQVDTLEKNKTFSLVFHDVDKLHSDGTKSDFFNYKEGKAIFKPIELWENWFIPTASVLYRTGIMEDLSKLNYPRTHGDLDTFLKLGEFGDFYFIPQKMAVYRIHEEGITKSKFLSIAYLQRHLDQLDGTNIYFNYKYDKQIRKRAVGYCLTLAYLHAKSKNKKESFNFVKRSFKYNIIETIKSKYLYVTLFYLFIKF